MELDCKGLGAGWKEGIGSGTQLEEDTTGQSVGGKTEAPDVVALPPSSC